MRTNSFQLVVFVAVALQAAGCARGQSAGSSDSTVQQRSIAVGGPHKPDAPPGAAPISDFIVVDQFGYRPNSEKIAVIRDPEKGYDADKSFSPGKKYALVEVDSVKHVHTGGVRAWREGAVDESSGDRAHWFDFSSVKAPGKYYVLDVDNNVRSPAFTIAEDVYRVVLRHALRTFFYQRAGFAKEAKYAGEGWADAASHIGPLQDKNCRLYKSKNDAKTERDLHGGWYDAGDYNKYTNWHAGYVISLFRTFEERPEVFGDDFGIPESGNGLPDIVDEVKFGMDWLVRMQNPDGSVLSIVALASGSPPSAAKDPSVYGSASTSATLSTAAAFAYGAKFFEKLEKPELKAYSADLLKRAERAWNWADKNAKVTFFNNDEKHGTKGVGAGGQEVDDYGRLSKKVMAALYLYQASGKARYREFFDKNYTKIQLIENKFAYPFQAEQQRILLEYTKTEGATAAIADNIRNIYKNAIGGEHNLAALKSEKDPYRAYMKDYTWGSNAIKSNQGSMYYDLITFGVDAVPSAQAERAAERYIHYIHGVNPLGMVYLSNMSGAGAERSVNEFYHSWFSDGSDKWDRVGISKYGPAPGFLVGGPNPTYDWDRCCPNNCGNPQNSAKCRAEPISPPKGQPPQKSYKDFNTSWPLNSWAVSENSNGYQIAYIRLLSKFVK